MKEQYCQELCVSLQKSLRKMFVSVRAGEDIEVDPVLVTFGELQKILDTSGALSIDTTNMVYDVVQDLNELISDLKDEVTRTRLKIISMRAQDRYKRTQGV